MPFTILKMPASGDAEVLGEYGTQAEAEAFIQGLRVEDPDSTYVVEPPPVPDSVKAENADTASET